MTPNVRNRDHGIVKQTNKDLNDMSSLKVKSSHYFWLTTLKYTHQAIECTNRFQTITIYIYPNLNSLKLLHYTIPE